MAAQWYSRDATFLFRSSDVVNVGAPAGSLGRNVQPGLCAEFPLHERTSQTISGVNRSVIYHARGREAGPVSSTNTRRATPIIL